MAANAMTSDYMRLEVIMAENAKVIKNVTDSIKGFSYSPAKEPETSDFDKDCNKILSHTSMSIKMYASSSFKKSEFLEISEIDRIKTSLANFSNNDAKVEEFKNELIGDLTEFQNQIKTNHIRRTEELTKQKQIYEKELNVLKHNGYKPKKSNFLQIVWAVNVEKQEHDSRIDAISAKVEQLTLKLTELKETRPLANAKDILMYRMYIKEKYSR